ncbi:MAG: hypothetical protein K6C94_07065 [Candidatus Gastranaerophilales bacterium]|nr:hypothetical protein [Candidatus Gastranaerophilales bacterium]
MAEHIIILSGKQFCGKDTVAKILTEKLPSFHRTGLADAIKLTYSERTGLSLEEIEKNKSKYRPDLIALGNEGRAKDEDFWLKTVIAQKGSVIVPDVRVPHEIEIFKQHNAFCIRVEASAETRAKRGTLSRENDYTETALDNYDKWDYIIKNEDTYDTLVKNTEQLIQAILKHFDI